MKNRINERFMKKMSNKVNIQKTKEFHEEAIKYIEEHLDILKSVPIPDFNKEILDKEIGLTTYILELLKGLRKSFNKIG